MASTDAQTPRANWRQDGNLPILELAGNWQRGGTAVVITGIAPDHPVARYETAALDTFDSTLPAFLLAHLRSYANGSGEIPSLEGLPANLRGLLELALAVPEEIVENGATTKVPFTIRLGKLSLEAWASTVDVVEFVGQCSLSVGRFLTGRARFRTADLWLSVQECGIEALPIVTLISFLIGMILAFVGNAQLTNFGANLLVADLVSIAMVREMGVVMTAIIMSGRTGAAFAAHIGSMKSNEEIDALRTSGFDPFDFLVLPRLLALVVMMPVLTVYSNIVGILGGMMVGSFVGIPAVLFWNETLLSITITTSSLGIMASLKASSSALPSPSAAACRACVPADPQPPSARPRLMRLSPRSPGSWCSTPPSLPSSPFLTSEHACQNQRSRPHHGLRAHGDHAWPRV